MGIVTQKQKLKLAAWERAKNSLTEAKKLEAELFDEVIDLIFPDRKEGVNIAPLGGGYTAHCTQANKRKVDPDDLKAVLKELPRNFKKKLIKTSVSLIKAGYDNLSDEHRAIFDDCLTTVPGKPVLKINPRKKED